MHLRVRFASKCGIKKKTKPEYINSELNRVFLEQTKTYINMNKLFIIALIALVGLVNCDRFSVGRDDDDYEKQHMQHKQHMQQRSKRRLQDVEKLMIEDEVMSYLICDVCEKYMCDPKYCRFCSQCILKLNGMSSHSGKLKRNITRTQIDLNVQFFKPITYWVKHI